MHWRGYVIFPGHCQCHQCCVMLKYIFLLQKIKYIHNVCYFSVVQYIEKMSHSVAIHFIHPVSALLILSSHHLSHSHINIPLILLHKFTTWAGVIPRWANSSFVSEYSNTEYGYSKCSMVVKFCPAEVVSPANVLIHSVYINLQFILYVITVDLWDT